MMNMERDFVKELSYIVLKVIGYVDDKYVDPYRKGCKSLMNVPQDASIVDKAIDMAKSVGLDVVDCRSKYHYVKIKCDANAWIRFNLYYMDNVNGKENDLYSLDVTDNVYYASLRF